MPLPVAIVASTALRARRASARQDSAASLMVRLYPPPVRIEELTPHRWPALERLFGPNGACGGCWCMYWRIRAGERYEEVKGAPAKRRFKSLVRKGKAHGLLAFVGDEPVGWCAFERRIELPRLDRAPSLRVDDANQVWSLPCFFIKAGWRGKG